MEHGLTVGLMEVQKMYKMDDDKYNINHHLQIKY